MKIVGKLIKYYNNRLNKIVYKYIWAKEENFKR